MALLRSLLFTIFFYGGSVPLVLASLVAGLWGRPALRVMARLWARYHRLCARLFLATRTRIEGPLPREPVLVASKHQSMYETLDLMVLLDSPGVVIKRELADIPLWGGLAQRYGLIPVDRAGGAAALRRMLRTAGEVVAEGRPILIFPEGTRVLPGEKPPLQPGFAGLYRALGLPVVPLALDSGALWPRRSFLKRPGIVTLRFGEPIPPGLPRKEIEARVHAAINALEP